MFNKKNLKKNLLNILIFFSGRTHDNECEHSWKWLMVCNILLSMYGNG